MSHVWILTGVFPYATGPEAGRQLIVCERCGFESHRHEAPGVDEKVWYRPLGCSWENRPPEVSYFTCDEIILLKVMDS